MAVRNLTIPLDDALIRRAKVYAATHGTSITALVRNHLEAITRDAAAAETDPVALYAAGKLDRRLAMQALDVDYLGLLDALAERGLSVPTVPNADIERMASEFAEVWKRSKP